MLTSYLGTNLLKHKNCSGSRTAIWVSNNKIRYIFILFFAWMNYVSGSVIMVLINQIISVITAVFLVFSCLLLPTGFFPPLSYPNYSFKLLKRYDVLSCFLLCAHFHGNHMRFSLYFFDSVIPGGKSDNWGSTK